MTNWKRYEYPQYIRNVAKTRVAELYNRPYYLQLATLPILLESAYLQGLIDAVESLDAVQAIKNQDKALK